MNVTSSHTPGSPFNGDIYLIPASGSGLWLSLDGEIAAYYNGWIYFDPVGGMVSYVQDEKIWIAYAEEEDLWHPVQEIYSTAEYWTGEYFNTAKVYGKNISVGTLPNTTSANTAHSITGLALLVDLLIVADNGTKQIKFPYVDAAGDGTVYAHVTDTNIVVTADDDFSGYTGSAKIKYTKS